MARVPNKITRKTKDEMEMDEMKNNLTTNLNHTQIQEINNKK